jgi:hypothetical protein
MDSGWLSAPPAWAADPKHCIFSNHDGNGHFYFSVILYCVFGRLPAEKDYLTVFCAGIHITPAGLSLALFMLNIGVCLAVFQLKTIT